VSSQNWVSLLTPDTIQGSGPGATLNTATTATLSPVLGSTADVAQVNAPGFYQGWATGDLFRVLARGYLTTTGTSTTVTFLLAARVGNAGTTYVTLATTAGVATGTGALTGLPWQIDGMIRHLREHRELAVHYVAAELRVAGGRHRELRDDLRPERVR